MTDAADGTPLSPDEAFGVLGNGTRMEILQALGDADEPLSFSALHDRVDVRDSGQFNYHLEQLTGHFVAQTDAGYDLRQAGRRVIEAVLSGAVTDAPEIDLTHVDETCPLCGGDVAMTYLEERVRVYCTSCEGTYGGSSRRGGSEVPEEYGYLGSLLLPPAGVQDRTESEVFEAAWTWANLEILAMASGLCPRCAGTIENGLDVCEDHDASDGLCPVCENRHAVSISADCTNCNYGHWGGVPLRLAAETSMLTFLLDHVINPVAPDSESRHRLDRVHQNYAEEVLETDPLRVRFTFAIDGDELVVTIDDELRIVAVEGDVPGLDGV